MKTTIVSLCLGLALALAAAPSAWAHTSGENYVWLNIDDTHLEGRFEIRLADLRDVLGIDLPEEYDAALARIVETQPVVQAYVEEHFSVSANGRAIPLEFTETTLLRSPRLGHFAQFHYRTPEFDVPDAIDIRNTLIFESSDDPLHRSLVCIEFNRKSGIVYSEPGDPSEGEKKRVEFTAQVFGPGNTEQTLDLLDVGGLIPVRSFVWEGVRHLWYGPDHILFLIALLIPAVLRRNETNDEWEPLPHFRRAFINVVKIVTLFTVAHSITLSLAALGLVQLPSALVEPVIALSIILVALNNIWPIFRDKTWVVIVFFGLFHGLGFASVMGDLPFRMVNLLGVLLAFNIGIELGQLAIVAVVFPLLSMIRATPAYRPAILTGGSVAIVLVSSVWLVQRAFDL